MLAVCFNTVLTSCAQCQLILTYVQKIIAYPMQDCLNICKHMKNNTKLLVFISCAFANYPDLC